MSNQKYDEMRLKIEAILFSYGDWITISEIMESLSENSEMAVKNILEELKQKYEMGFPFTVENEDNRWRMSLKDEFNEIVSSLISGTEIPRNVLKVLSVIAYEQPITKTRLSEILGKYVKEEVDYLAKAKFVSYEKHGVGRYYRVTKKFYDYFKLEQNEEFREHANENLRTYLKSDEQIVKDIGLEYTTSETTNLDEKESEEEIDDMESKEKIT